MTIAELIPLILKISMISLVFVLGLKSDAAELGYLVKRPSQLVRSLFSINFVMVLVAIVIVKIFAISHTSDFMIVALALAPIPPLLPKKQAKAKGNSAYAISLVVTAAIFAIVSIPLSLQVVELVTGVASEVAPLIAMKLILATIIVPLAAGLIVQHFAPGIANKIGGPLGRIATLLLLVAVVVAFLGVWRDMWSLVGDGTVLALAVFVAAGLIIGHFLGGPDPSDRAVLALATASRHPGIAMTLIALARPGTPSLPAAVFLYLIISAIVVGLYVAWSKKHGVALPAP